MENRGLADRLDLDLDLLFQDSYGHDPYACRGSRSKDTWLNKKYLKNVGPIHHNEPPHANSPDVASGTVARRLRIDFHDNDDNDNA